MRGWWPRWRFNPLSRNSAEIAVDGRVVATIDGLGRRRWRTQLPAGTHTVEVNDLSGRRPSVVLPRDIVIEPGGLVVVQFRGPYRRFLAGRRVPTECWIAEGRPRATWFRPGAVPPPAFVPVRWRRTVCALDDLGWPVVDGPSVGWRELATISAR